MAAPLLRRAAERLAIRIAVSERAAAFERARIGGEFRIVPNGVEASRFADASPADLGPGRKLLFVGRLDERKGFPVAVRAFGTLAATRDDLHLIVAGDGPDRGAVDELPVALRARVAMLGQVANEELPEIAAACDVFLGSSVGGESFGVVLIEAMAAGVPVVASAIPGYDEVVRHEVDGVLVAPSDPGALAAAAGAILDDAARAERLRAGGRERARSFDWIRVVAMLEDLYAEALATSPPRLR
jgi:phosphatidylinositol alpha-mannosyltransferase